MGPNIDMNNTEEKQKEFLHALIMSILNTDAIIEEFNY